MYLACDLLDIWILYQIYINYAFNLLLQRIHKSNRGSEATFCLSEIEIPSVYNGPPSAPRSVLGDLIRAVESVCCRILMWPKLHYGYLS